MGKNDKSLRKGNLFQFKNEILPTIEEVKNENSDEEVKNENSDEEQKKRKLQTPEEKICPKKVGSTAQVGSTFVFNPLNIPSGQEFYYSIDNKDVNENNIASQTSQTPRDSQILDNLKGDLGSDETYFQNAKKFNKLASGYFIGKYQDQFREANLTFPDSKVDPTGHAENAAKEFEKIINNCGGLPLMDRVIANTVEQSRFNGAYNPGCQIDRYLNKNGTYNLLQAQSDMKEGLKNNPCNKPQGNTTQPTNTNTTQGTNNTTSTTNNTTNNSNTTNNQNNTTNGNLQDGIREYASQYGPLVGGAIGGGVAFDLIRYMSKNLISSDMYHNINNFLKYFYQCNSQQKGQLKKDYPLAVNPESGVDKLLNIIPVINLINDFHRRFGGQFKKINAQLNQASLVAQNYVQENKDKNRKIEDEKERKKGKDNQQSRISGFSQSRDQSYMSQNLQQKPSTPLIIKSNNFTDEIQKSVFPEDKKISPNQTAVFNQKQNNSPRDNAIDVSFKNTKLAQIPISLIVNQEFKSISQNNSQPGSPKGQSKRPPSVYNINPVEVIISQSSPPSSKKPKSQQKSQEGFYREKESSPKNPSKKGSNLELD